MLLSKSIPAVSAALLAAILAGGCGFQLRGSELRPEGISSVHVEAPSSILTDELEATLESVGIDVSATREDADLTLIVGSEIFDRRVLSVDPNTGKAREYELSYTAPYRAVRRGGEGVIQGQTVQLLRDYVFDEDALIGKSREQSVLRDEMRRDAVQQILRRLRAALNN